jgi:hypothetical protein
MKKPSLNELMGSGGQAAKSRKLSLDDLGNLLGERMPKLEYTPVGRLRLTTALRNRFGDSYKNLPGISDIMQEFDREAHFGVKLQEMKMIKPKAKGK